MTNDQELEIKKIISKYEVKEHSDYDELRTLDRRVTRPVEIFTYTAGAISALIMGAGMSLVMTDIGKAVGLGDAFIPGLALGIVGMAMAALVYPIRKKMLASRREKYGAKIIALSNKLMNI